MNPLPAGPFGVIYADPSWRFEPWSRITGMGRAAEKRYPTMTLEPIKALRIPAAEDSVLFHIMACELGPNVWSALVYRLDHVVEAAFLRPAELIAYRMSGSKGPRSRH